MARQYFINGLELVVRKDFYTGLWNVVYAHGGKWSGPYRTKREAVAKIEAAAE